MKKKKDSDQQKQKSFGSRKTNLRIEEATPPSKTHNEGTLTSPLFPFHLLPRALHVLSFHFTFCRCFEAIVCYRSFRCDADFKMPPSLSRSSRDSHNSRRSLTTLPSRFSCSHDSSVKSIFMSKNKQTDILRALKALRRSIKGEKEGKIQHVSIAPKSALAIVPPKKVRQNSFRNRKQAFKLESLLCTAKLCRSGLCAVNAHNSVMRPNSSWSQ